MNDANGGDTAQPAAASNDATQPDQPMWTFAMGEHLASFPQQFHFAKNHMWAHPASPSGGSGADQSDEAADRSETDGGRVWTFGLSEYAVRLLQDVYFLDWTVDAGIGLTLRQMIGSIESKKAESDLYSPVAGKLVAVNEEVLEEPSLINADPYGQGWLIRIWCLPDAESELMSAERYAAHLEEAWVVAQRTIKGQANE